MDPYEGQLLELATNPNASKVEAVALIEDEKFNRLSIDTLIRVTLIAIKQRSKKFLEELLRRRSVDILATKTTVNYRDYSFFESLIGNSNVDADAETITLLINYGADPNYRQMSNFSVPTPLMRSILEKKIEITRALLQYEKLSLEESYQQRTAFSFALLQRDPVYAEELFAHGANPGPRRRDNPKELRSGIPEMRDIYATRFSDPEKIQKNLLARRLRKFSNETPNQSLPHMELIFTFVTNREDFSQLRLVCKTWRRVAETVLAGLPLAFFEF
jgi:CO dehydrogenase/acetyl-CoA synthase epsilon subunit